MICNERRNKLKILELDTSGFWLLCKWLEKDKFTWTDDNKGTHIYVDKRSFRWLLDGLTIRKYMRINVEKINESYRL